MCAYVLGVHRQYCGVGDGNRSTKQAAKPNYSLTSLSAHHPPFIWPLILWPHSTNITPLQTLSVAFLCLAFFWKSFWDRQTGMILPHQMNRIRRQENRSNAIAVMSSVVTDGIVICGTTTSNIGSSAAVWTSPPVCLQLINRAINNPKMCLIECDGTRC